MSHPLEGRAREIHALLNEQGCGFYDDGSGPGDKCLDCENILALLTQVQAEALVKLQSYAQGKLEGRADDVFYQIVLKIFNNGFELAHELAQCGHSRGDWRDPDYVPGVSTESECKCIGCQREAEARLAKLNFRLHEDSVEIACCLFNKQLLSGDTIDDAAQLIEAWMSALAQAAAPAKEETIK